MRIANLALLAGLALTACDQEPAFDASTSASYQRSLAAITAKLNADDQRRLDIALLTLVLGNTARSNALLLASPASLTHLAALDDIANPMLYIELMRPEINGRTAAGVIRRVAADLDDEISVAEARSAGAEKALAGIAISNPRYHWDSRSNFPTIEFSVLNGSKHSISRIYVSGQLTQSGRSEKWRTEGLSYKFDRALEAGEQTSVKLLARVVSASTSKQLQALYDADITIKVTNVEDADGNKLVPIDVDVLDGMRNKRNFLRGS